MSLLFVSLSGKTSGLLMIVAHGYTSTLMFYFIGEFYNFVGTRIIYYFNRFFCSSSLVSILFSLCILSNMGVPVSLSFISEFFSLSNMYILFRFIFFILFLYFFISFYYSIFLVVSSFMGKSYINFKLSRFYYSIFLVFMCYNVF